MTDRTVVPIDPVHTPQLRGPRRRTVPGGRIVDALGTTDAKRIGVLYLVTSFGFFLVGGVLALLMRAELARPGLQFLSTEQYNQLFTMHGTIMLLLFATPLVFGFGNFLVPLQIGAADVAFPRLNALAYWLFLTGGLVTLGGFATPGGAADFGWFAYAPLNSRVDSPGTGSDLWIMGLVVAGVGTVIGAVNMVTTVVTLRAPGMTMFRMPILTWNIFVTAVMVLMAFPVLTAALLVLEADRKFGAHVFDAAVGGPLLWQHLFWFFGHPEVYIVALPFFGIVTEILPVFSRRPIFGYKGLVGATIAIAVLSMGVWAHHMFVTGNVLLPFFSFLSYLIAVPTGIKFFNWIGSMWRGQLTFATPMLWSLGFLVTFLFGTIVFAAFGGVYFWFPKITGRMLNERLGQVHFWLTFVGFHTTFLVQHWLGTRGMPRRYADYLASDGFTTYNTISSIGALILGVSMLPLLYNLWSSYRFGRTVEGNDPWGFTNSLEWATTCPPPRHNFTRLPRIRSNRPVFDDVHGG